jgi:hypothetical protein
MDIEDANGRIDIFEEGLNCLWRRASLFGDRRC